MEPKKICLTISFSDDKEETSDKSISYQYRIKLKFSTKVFGSFKQSLIFDFGTKPLLYKVGYCKATTKKLTYEIILLLLISHILAVKIVFRYIF